MEFNLSEALRCVDRTAAPATTTTPQEQPQQWRVVEPSQTTSDIKDRFYKALLAAEKVYNVGVSPSLRTDLDREEKAALLGIMKPILQEHPLEVSRSKLQETTENSLLKDSKQKNYGTFN
ncbi:MAG: hypothetical protein K2W99_01120 [Chthoniobacterales bacterium]|nr:hypothetical protein [Chthoniobacterales bacterium]